jgi:hypothetical protein
MKTELIIVIGLLLIVGCSSNEKTHAEDELHDHSVEIEGSDMKQLSVQQVADLWEIDSEVLLNQIIEEFNFKGNYTTETVLEDMRLEYKFSPAIIKDIAEDIKHPDVQHE